MKFQLPALPRRTAIRDLSLAVVGRLKRMKAVADHRDALRQLTLHSLVDLEEDGYDPIRVKLRLEHIRLMRELANDDFESDESDDAVVELLKVQVHRPATLRPPGT